MWKIVRDWSWGQRLAFVGLFVVYAIGTGGGIFAHPSSNPWHYINSWVMVGEMLLGIGLLLFAITGVYWSMKVFLSLME